MTVQSKPTDAPTAKQQQQQEPKVDGSVKLNAQQIAFFNRQLASMAKLSMPIPRGLKVMEREVADSQFLRLIQGVQRDLEEGRSLQEALARYPNTFGPNYIEMLKAGESTGNLSVVLEELTRYTETLARIRTQLRDAMLYPAVIGSLTLLFVLSFFWFLIPNFAALYASADLVRIVDGRITEIAARVDWQTSFLFQVSNVLRDPLVLIFGGLLAVGLGGYAVHKVRRGWETYDEYMFRLPLFGGLIKQATLLKVIRCMRDLLANGVSMVNALRLSARIAGNNRIRRGLEEVCAVVEEGQSFSKALSPDVFTATIVWKLQIGEEKGILEDALGEVATELERDIESSTSYLTAVISPILLVGTALILVLLMLSIYPQLIGLATSMGR